MGRVVREGVNRREGTHKSDFYANCDKTCGILANAQPDLQIVITSGQADAAASEVRASTVEIGYLTSENDKLRKSRKKPEKPDILTRIKQMTQYLNQNQNIVNQSLPSPPPPATAAKRRRGSLMDGRMVLCAVAFVFAGLASAGEAVVCTTLPVHASILNGREGHTLAVTVENPTARTVGLQDFFFGENMMRFSAKEGTGGRTLKVVIPLLSPDVEPLTIKPHDKVVRQVRLDVVFPDLASALRRSAVEISWQVTLKPDDGCFSEEVATTMTLVKGQ